MLSNKTKMYRPPGIGGGGIKMVLYREAPPRGPNPYTNPPSPPPPPPLPRLGPDDKTDCSQTECCF